MSKWYGISHEGDMYSLGKCKDLQEANEVADDMWIDIDLLIDGKFIERLKVEDGLRGSSNQNFIYLSSKVSAESVEFDRAIEVGISFITGFPIIDKSYLKKFGIRLL